MNGYQWTILFAAWLGWGFDVFDGLLFNYVAVNCVPTLLGIKIGSPEAGKATLQWVGILTALLLVFWGIGGIVFGRLCDRIGRSKTLLLTMVMFELRVPAAAGRNAMSIVHVPATPTVPTQVWATIGNSGALSLVTAETVTAAVPQLAELEQLRGRVGKTVSPMRPSGTVEFDNTRVDAMTEGVMIDAGVFVRCVDVRGGKVIVRQMDAPRDIVDINLDDPKPAPRRDPLDDIDLDLGPR
jgi:hypothetical protein